MCQALGAHRILSSRGRLPLGFTLVETVLVIGLLTLASLAIAKMMPQVFTVQTLGRDEAAGFELMRGCAERLLSVRRQSSGYTKVDDKWCKDMGGVGGYASNVSVTLTPSTAATAPACSNASATCHVCSGTTCTATIVIAKTSGQAAALTPLTVQFSNY